VPRWDQHPFPDPGGTFRADRPRHRTARVRGDSDPQPSGTALTDFPDRGRRVSTIAKVSPVRPSVQVVGRRMDAQHYRLRDFLTRTAQPYEWHEAESPEADLFLDKLGLRDATLPVLVDGDEIHTDTSVQKIAVAWGGLQPP